MDNPQVQREQDFWLYDNFCNQQNKERWSKIRILPFDIYAGRLLYKSIW